jgi:pilus assembly protein CpaB
MSAGTRLKKGDLKLVNVVERDIPRGAMLDLNPVIDRVLLFPISQNEPVTGSKLASVSGVEGLAATIDVGKRAFSVPITDISGAAGLIQPRSHVDVLFTRTGSMSEALTTVVLQDIVVLSIGRVTEVSQLQSAPGQASTAARSQTQAATLLVTPEEAAKLEFCKNQGKVSLMLRNPLDKTRQEDADPVIAESLSPALLARRNRGPAVNVRDPRAWNRLISGSEAPAPTPPPKPKEEKKEPPKPRYVVDVYRGDKHYQETFQ